MINLNEEAILGTQQKYIVTNETDFLESYFRSGLENASELTEAYAKISSDLYIALKENATNSISAFMSFYNGCKNIFGAYIIRLNNNMYNQFSSALKSRIREDKKIIDKYKNKLNNYSGKDIALSVTRYEYSNIFTNDIPSLKVFESFKNERDQLNILLKATGDETRKNIISSEFKEIKNYIRSGECYNNARASILKKSDPIEACDYAKAIFDIYRSGGDQIVDYTIKASQIKDIVKRFYSYEQYIDNINRQKKEIFKQYKHMLDNLENYDMFQIKNIIYDDEILAEYSLYVKIKIDQLKHYCSLYLNAFDGKLDAVANSYMQDRDILLKICGYLVADNDKKEEEL